MSGFILAINPGSTSTKIGLFSGNKCLLKRDLNHDIAELDKLTDQKEQIELRLKYIREFLTVAETEGTAAISKIDLIMARGGLIGPVSSGVYVINEAMKQVLRSEFYGSHASNLGALIADRLSQEIGKPAYIADPPSVDEMSPVARYSGLKSIERLSLFHALNHKAAAREAASIIGHAYEELQLIVCHMGGGISVGLHSRGRVVDVNNALEEGPMSPERAGSLPSLSLLRQFSESGSEPDQFRKVINGRGGLASYTGSANEKELEAAMQLNHGYKEAIDAMIYQIIKEIGALAAIASGCVDAIVLTGGLAKSDYVCGEIEQKTSFIAGIIRIPGERELQALAAAGLRLLAGGTKPLKYDIPCDMEECQ